MLSNIHILHIHMYTYMYISVLRYILLPQHNTHSKCSCYTCIQTQTYTFMHNIHREMCTTFEFLMYKSEWKIDYTHTNLKKHKSSKSDLTLFTVFTQKTLPALTTVSTNTWNACTIILTGTCGTDPCIWKSIILVSTILYFLMIKVEQVKWK